MENQIKSLLAMHVASVCCLDIVGHIIKPLTKNLVFYGWFQQHVIAFDGCKPCDTCYYERDHDNIRRQLC
jgi:hypothetical protein